MLLGATSDYDESNIFSNSTDQTRIEEISNDILATVIVEIKESPMFALQLDESPDLVFCSQLLVFTRYIKDNCVKQEYLFLDLYQLQNAKKIYSKH